MKQRKFLFAIALIMLPLVVLFGQVDSWQDLYDNYPVFFATSGGIAGIAMFLGELVQRVLKITVKWQKIAVVWVISVIAALAGSFVLNVGYLAEASWWETGIWGLFIGLIANGIWSSNIAFIKSILEFFVGLIKAKLETPVTE